MDSNYQWQKHQVNERAQARRREAQAQQMLNEPSLRRDHFLIRALNWLSGKIASRTPGRRHESWPAEPTANPRVKEA
jgi:hypothetical protein